MNLMVRREKITGPYPDKKFYMILRAYGPDESIIEQTWITPVTEVVK